MTLSDAFQQQWEEKGGRRGKRKLRWKGKGEHTCMEQIVGTSKLQRGMHTESGKGRDWDKKRAWCTEL